MNAKEISNRFKIRASAAGSIMTKTFAKTVESYCQNWLLEQPEFMNMRVNEFSNSYTSKGNAVEKDSLDFISRMKYNGDFLIPNVEKFENEYMTGTPDNIQPDHIFDNKASWLPRTFPFFDNELKNSDYDWQGQVYMNLADRKKHVVYYTLMNTPEWLIQRAINGRAYELGYEEPTPEIIEEITLKMNFDHIPDEMRIKSFSVDYDQKKIDSLIERVKECRKYIETLILTYDN